MITLGVSDRSEADPQNMAVHGAYTALAPAASYTLTFQYDLSSWDGYSAELGFWDLFSMSLSTSAYCNQQLAPLGSPSSIPGLIFSWDGDVRADGTVSNRTTGSGVVVVTVPGDPVNTSYLSLVLDTTNSPNADRNYPSWGTFTVLDITPGYLPLVPPPVDSERNPPDSSGGYGANGIHTLTGSYTYSHTDLAIPGRGPSPTFVRSYNSNDDRNGPLGIGWTHSYNIRLNDPWDCSQNVVLVGPQGRSDTYTRNADGSYTPPKAVYTSLVKNGDGTYTATLKDQTVWTFDSGGWLTNIVDRYGNRSSLTYTGGQLTAITDPAGRGSVSLVYNGSGRLQTVTDWANRTVTYDYDGAGRLWKVTDRENQATTFGYYDSTRQFLTTITDANNHVLVRNDYDPIYRIATQQDAWGASSQSSFSFVTNGDDTKTTTATYPATPLYPTWAPTVQDSYDTLGRLTRRVPKPSSAESVVTDYAYDSNYNVIQIKDGNNNITDLCYDTDYSGVPTGSVRGNLTRRIDPAPYPGAARPVTLLEYDSRDNLIQVVSPRGVPSTGSASCSDNFSGFNSLYATDYVYDANGVYLLSVSRRYVDPDLGQQTATARFYYDDAANPGLVTRIVPPRGNTGGSPDYSYATTMTYFGSGSESGMLQSTTDPLGNKVTNDYDSVGRRVSRVDANGNAPGANPAEHTWTYSYDNEDRPRFSYAPAPTPGGSQLVTENRYDPVGNRTVAIDAAGQVTKYVYDERNALKEVHESPNPWTDPGAAPSPEYVTAYDYDDGGNLSRVTRAKGDGSYELATDYLYDGMNRLRREVQYPSWPSTSPTLVTEYEYDGNGNRTSLLDPMNQTTGYGYDNLNRLTSVQYSDGITPNAGYGFDADGNRTSMTDGTGSTSYSYDEMGRLLSVTSPGPGTVGYRYDLDGNRTKVIYPDGTAVDYSFDNASRLWQLSDWASRTVGYQYNPDGSIKQVTNFDGTSAAYSYDNASRLTQVWNQKGTDTISKHSYTLSVMGNRTREDRAPIQVQNAVWTWGDNNEGKLGDGTTTDHFVPAAVSGLGDVIAVAGSSTHSVAVRSDGTVWAWGDNTSGELGDGTTTSHYTPIQVVGLNGVTAVAAGDSYSLALKSDGTLWAWGSNTFGELGDGTTTARHTPVQVSGLAGVTAIAAGYMFSWALKSDGTVWAWGDNSDGQLCDGSTTTRLSPVQIRRFTGVTGIAAGRAHSLAVKSDGTVWGCGWNSSGQVGDGTTRDRKTFVQVAGISGATAVAAGWRHSLALKSDGTVWAWGDGMKGQIGDGTTEVRLSPVRVGSISGVNAISAGFYSSLALKSGVGVWQWGLNGDVLDSAYPWPCSIYYGLTPCSLTPYHLPGLDGATAIAGGGYHSLAIAPATLNQFTDYAYDRLNRLISTSGAGTGSTYTYDPTGNRSSRTQGASTSYSYDRADRITSAGTTGYTVNSNGNLTARGSDTFSYDQANRLKAATVGGTSSSYVYNGDGDRTSKTVGGVATGYLYDVNRSLAVVLDDGTRKYVWGPGLAYAVDSSGNPLVYHTDGLGSIRAITDATGAVVETYQTDEFGVPASSQGTVTQPFGYTGEIADPETGLVFLRARYYDPAVGRFMSRDPYPGAPLSPQSLNRYSYAGNNPINRIDPSGKIAWVPILLAAWAVIEFGSTVWDAVDTAQTIADPNASLEEKALSGGLFVAGLGLPGSGGMYKRAAHAGEEVLKSGHSGIRLLPFKDADRLGEVNKTLDRIEAGGPFPHQADATVFKNREGLLPSKPEGYYREYTVDTPGATNRGTRRVVQGTGGETYYTDDHYGNFIQIDPRRY